MSFEIDNYIFTSSDSENSKKDEEFYKKEVKQLTNNISNFMNNIKSIKSLEKKYDILKYLNDIMIDNNLYLDIIAEKNECIKTNMKSVFSDKTEEKIFFYIDNKDAIYKTNSLSNLKKFLSDIKKNYISHKFVQLISNDAKRRCIFKFIGEDKKKLIEILKDKYKNKFSHINDYIISDIYVDDYNEYFNECEKLFQYLAECNINYNDMSILKKHFDKNFKKFFNELIFQINGKTDVKDIATSLLVDKNIINNITLNVNINDNSGSINVKNSKNVSNIKTNIAVKEKNEKAVKWLKSNLPNIFKLNEYVNIFKKNNPKVQHSTNNISLLLHKAGYKLNHTKKGNYWRKVGEDRESR